MWPDQQIETVEEQEQGRAGLGGSAEGGPGRDEGARRQARLQGPPPQRRRQVMTAVTGDRPVAAGNGSWARLARSEALRGFALVSPTFLYALLLLLAPILVIVAFTFWTPAHLTNARPFTLSNYPTPWTQL